jgi:hypothetical protein
MILVGTNWTSRGGSEKTKLVRRKQGNLVEEDEDGEALQMLKNVPLKKKKWLQQKKTPKKTIKAKVEENKDRKNWVDGNVETLIAFHGIWS